jgi:hypothetical protein
VQLDAENGGADFSRPEKVFGASEYSGTKALLRRFFDFALEWISLLEEITREAKEVLVSGEVFSV